MNSGMIAAGIAREAARGQGTYFTVLSNQMCWDAVALCQGRAAGPGVDINGTPVMGDLDVCKIPLGASIGFFDKGGLIHEMIAVGAGEVCGNKNACIGYGNPIGWELVDLRNLPILPDLGVCWGSGGIFGPRSLQVRYRAI